MVTGLPFTIFSFKCPLLSPLSTLFTLSSVPFQSLLTHFRCSCLFQEGLLAASPTTHSYPLALSLALELSGYCRDLSICFSGALLATYGSAQFAVSSLTSEDMASVEGSLWSLLGRMEPVLRLPGAKLCFHACSLLVCDLRLQMWLLDATLFLVCEMG